MPTAYVKKVAKKHKISTAASESNWKKAKSVAKKQGHDGEFAYITSIYKKMVGEDAKLLGLKDFLILSEWDKSDEYDSPDDSDEFDEDCEGDECYKDDKLRDFEESYNFMMTGVPLIERRYKNLEKSAADVYHRDYMKTKDKKYRKYSAKNRARRATPVEEGLLDYARGAGGYLGTQATKYLNDSRRKIAEPFEKIHAAGKERSRQAEINKKNDIIKQGISELARIIEHRKKLVSQIRELGESVEYTNEGLWDYFKGASSSAGSQVAASAKEFGHAAKEFGGKLATGVENVHRAGRKESLRSEYERTLRAEARLVSKIADIIVSMGGDKMEIVSKYINGKYASKHLYIANRINSQLRTEIRNRSSSASSSDSPEF